MVEPVDNGSWVQRTFSGKRASDTSVREWIFGPDGLAETVTVGTWDKMLRWSTPVFQLCEGFCSLLVIQSAGQITRWLVNRGGRSDSWMVRLSHRGAWTVLMRDGRISTLLKRPMGCRSFYPTCGPFML